MGKLLKNCFWNTMWAGWRWPLCGSRSGACPLLWAHRARCARDVPEDSR